MLTVIAIALTVAATIAFVYVPLPRPFGKPNGDRRNIIYWSFVAAVDVVGVVLNIEEGGSLGAAWDTLMLFVALAMLWHYIRRTRRGKRAAKAIGEKARALRDALVRTQRTAERKLRAALPQIEPNPA